MTTIESNRISVPKTTTEVVNFLQQMRNIEQLLPEQCENFSADETTCRFDIKGMGSMGLKLGEVSNQKITYLKNEKAPFDFSLVATIHEASANETNVQLIFEADLNPIFKMMAEKPLTNFVNHLIQKFQTIMNA